MNEIFKEVKKQNVNRVRELCRENIERSAALSLGQLRHVYNQREQIVKIIIYIDYICASVCTNLQYQSIICSTISRPCFCSFSWVFRYLFNTGICL
jgi:hypothetical protein